ncbi:hypothetical protein NUKP43_31840 [Klebsiella quasipneumoniae]|nr:hypothetical protein NUKP43_31840 [Klebsiella quasipneumoniae]
MLVNRFPGIAQTQLASGTLQQFAAHLSLQPRHATANRGRGNAALAGDGGEAALVDDLYEEGKVGQEVQIHLCSWSKSALANDGIIAVGINNYWANREENHYD